MEFVNCNFEEIFGYCYILSTRGGTTFFCCPSKELGTSIKYFTWIGLANKLPEKDFWFSFVPNNHRSGSNEKQDRKMTSYLSLR